MRHGRWFGVRGARRALVGAGAVLLVSMATVGQAPAEPPPFASPVPLGTLVGPGHADAYPWGVATMRDGSVLVGDYWNFRVLRYAADGSARSVFIADQGFGPTQHQAPYGLAVDPVDGSVYMADTDRYTVNKYAEDGTFLFRFGVLQKSVGGANGFKYPSRVAVGPDQRVYVADSWDHVVSVHHPDGTEIRQFGGFGTGPGQMKQPHGLAFDGDGLLHVTDPGNKRVNVFDAEGTWLRTYGGPRAPFSGDLRGLAIDTDNDWVYVVDGQGNRVSKFATDGTFLQHIGGKAQQSPPEPGKFSDGGREVTVDANGRIWVGDWPNFRVQVFNPDGTLAFVRPDPAAPPPAGGVNGPRGVAVDPRDGGLAVTDTYNQRVQTFSSTGSFEQQWGARGRSDYAFNYPRMLAVDPRDGAVVVADTDNHRIRKYDENGVHLWSVGGLGSGTTTPTFRNPHGVDVAPDGRIAVADTQNGRVVVLDEQGRYLTHHGVKGSAAGQFQYVRGIAWDPLDGTLWTVDSGRDVVSHYDPATWTLLGVFGKRGTGADQFEGPFDIEVGTNFVYVAEAQHHQVQAWTRGGTWVASFGARGSQTGKFVQPQGLDLHGDLLYVAEQGNDRITAWQVTP